MPTCLLVINAGSSSIKFSLLSGTSAATLDCIAEGAIDGIGTAPHLHVEGRDGAQLAEHRWPADVSHEDLLGHLMKWIEAHLGDNHLTAAGHRITHGGLSNRVPQLVTPTVLAELQALTPLAPMHQPHNLAPIVALAARHPGLPQVACFDTAFHATNPRISRLYGLPAAMADEGILRFGFHGLSYEYIAGALTQYEPRARHGRAIVAHLGSGASMCALVGGQSVASSMGFSVLDGLPMGSRCGAVDPGVLLYLLQEKHLQVDELVTLLYQKSGLLGVSGISNDVRDLLQSKAPQALEAIDLFVYRAAREIGSLVAAAGGLDTLVFTAGIGEHAAPIRARICAQAAWLGVVLDPQANDTHGPRISRLDSPVSVWVIPTNEALMVARHTFALTVRSGDARQVSGNDVDASGALPANRLVVPPDAGIAD
ncbi:MAG: acetate/propionate family kinase [Herminiimonas sp.]|nr:acetate/propionate family kinase [Herminiimonas sp.]